MAENVPMFMLISEQIPRLVVVLPGVKKPIAFKPKRSDRQREDGSDIIVGVFETDNEQLVRDIKKNCSVPLRVKRLSDMPDISDESRAENGKKRTKRQRV